ncbi:MAG: anion permease, partial [Planctomycetes bacterium]|nr:anion permease [Planctomycetota bacterium]
MDPSISLIILIVVTLVLLVTQALPIELIALGIVGALPLLDILEPREALSGFSSPATITVGAMLVVSAGLERAGAVDWVAARLTEMGRGSSTRLLLTLALPTAALSAFMNNTPIVALMIPVVITLAHRFGTAPSKLLIPISTFAILGGMCTLIGTSTNILVDSLYRKAGGPGFGFFEFTGLGLSLLTVGLIYVVLLGPRLLPDREALSGLLSASGSGQFVTELKIPSGSRFVGQTIETAFRGADQVTVIELVRGEQPILRPAGTTVLQADDILLLEGSARTIHNLLEAPDLEHGTVVADEERV